MRALYQDARRVFDRGVAERLVLLTVVSVVVTGLDVVGIALLVPLVTSLSGSESDAAMQIPLVSGLATETLLGLVVGFFVVKSVVMALLRWWSTGVVAKSAAQSAIRLFAAYLNAPMSFHDQRNSADTVRTMNQTMQVLHGYGLSGAAMAVADGATLVVLAGFVFLVSPVPAIVGSVYLALAAVVFLRVMRARTNRHASEVQRLSAVVVLSLNEALGGLREHRIRGSEAHLQEEFEASRRALAHAERFTLFASELPRYFLETLVLGGFGIVAGVVLSTQSGPDALATLAVLLAAVFRIVPSLSRLMGSITNLRIGRSALTTLLADLDLMGVSRLREVRFEPEYHRGSDGRVHPEALELRGVTFAYGRSDVPALADVSLRVDPGQSLGVVGPSGAGKSTLIDIVCGLREPTAGAVIIGMTTAATAKSWRRSIGFVPQDVYILDGSIRRNVAFGLAEDDGRIWEALERAQLASLVRELPDGIDAVVGERGTRLSGGQRQRLGIARALYGEPSVLVLDEATAALDVETEAAVVDAIANLQGEVSLIVVAHRLSTIRRCDKVAYLDKGQLVAVGTFEELVDAVPEFSRAVRLAGLR